MDEALRSALREADLGDVGALSAAAAAAVRAGDLAAAGHLARRLAVAGEDPSPVLAPLSPSLDALEAVTLGRQLATGRGRLAWTADGARLFVLNGPTRLVEVEVASGARRVVSEWLPRLRRERRDGRGAAGSATAVAVAAGTTSDDLLVVLYHPPGELTAQTLDPRTGRPGPQVARLRARLHAPFEVAFTGRPGFAAFVQDARGLQAREIGREGARSRRPWWSVEATAVATDESGQGGAMLLGEELHVVAGGARTAALRLDGLNTAALRLLRCAGGHVAVADDQRVAVFDRSLRVRHSVLLPTPRGTTLLPAPGGRLLAVVPESDRAQVVDLDAGATRWFEPRCGPLLAAAWSPSGRELALLGTDGLALVRPRGR